MSAALLRQTPAGEALETRDSAILDALPLAVLLIAGDGTVVHANPAAEEVFGTSAAVLERAEAGERAHRLAEQGYWYAAFGQLSDWIGAGAEVAGLRDARAALLEQVDLEVAVERSVQ